MGNFDTSSGWQEEPIPFSWLRRPRHFVGFGIPQASMDKVWIIQFWRQRNIHSEFYFFLEFSKSLSRRATSIPRRMWPQSERIRESGLSLSSVSRFHHQTFAFSVETTICIFVPYAHLEDLEVRNFSSHVKWSIALVILLGQFWTNLLGYLIVSLCCNSVRTVYINSAQSIMKRGIEHCQVKG